MIQDHPRSRGDYRMPSLRERWNAGSPPLTRGLRLALGKDSRINRITPAHAGTTNCRCCNCRCCRITPAHAGTTIYDPNKEHQFTDHPRSRGDYFG